MRLRRVGMTRASQMVVAGSLCGFRELPGFGRQGRRGRLPLHMLFHYVAPDTCLGRGGFEVTLFKNAAVVQVVSGQRVGDSADADFVVVGDALARPGFGLKVAQQ